MKTTFNKPCLPEIFLEHNGVTLYHVYKSMDFEGRKTDFWYSTGSTRESNHLERFDIRNLGLTGVERIDPSLSICDRMDEWVRYVKQELIKLIEQGRITKKDINNHC